MAQLSLRFMGVGTDRLIQTLKRSRGLNQTLKRSRGYFKLDIEKDIEKVKGLF
jgi:hypothetical protein